MKCNHSSHHHTCCHDKKNTIQRPQNIDDQTLYICPMHPEVENIGPGDCPKCGMALEPKVAKVSDEPNPELIDYKKRFWVGLILALPIVILEMGSHITSSFSWISKMQSYLIQFILSVPIVMWSGAPFFKKAYRSFVSCKLNMFSLISMGVSIAFIYSCIALAFPNIFPASIRDSYGNVPVYFEAASVIIVLVLLGQILELQARENTQKAIQSLLKIAPKHAKKVTPEGDVDVPISDVQVGDMLIVRPGEKVPVDGLVKEGVTYIDESAISGEPIPVHKEERDHVIAGTMNTSGSIVIEAKKVGKDTMLSNIIHQVGQAQRSKAPIQDLVDKVSAWFVPLIFVISALTFMMWLLFAQTQSISYALVTSISVLIIACPCALGLATPLSIMVGVGKGAANGILAKNAQALEQFEQVDIILMDKTGTLTEGKPKINQIIEMGEGYSSELIIQLAASVERSSEHPLAKPIIEHAKEQNIELLKVANFESLPGYGVTGNINNQKVLIGSVQCMKKNNIDLSHGIERVNKQGLDDYTSVYVAVDNHIVGVLTIEDPIKENAKTLLTQLQKQGLKVIMVTGDSEKSAKKVANQLNISDYFYQVLPADKAKIVSSYQNQGYKVAMAGDGINDAVALAQADVGIAMGNGTDVAIESAGIALLKGNLERLEKAYILSKSVMANIRQNLGLAFGYNLLCVPIAAGILYPISGILLTPIFAAMAMSLSSISVVLNALRLNFVKLQN